MTDTLALLQAVDRLADAVRALPLSRLRRGVADEVLALARELARRAQLLEFPDREPAELPEVGVFAVGDQLAVAGHDLVMARRAVAAIPRGGAAGRDGEEGGTADDPVADDLALVRATARRCGLPC